METEEYTEEEWDERDSPDINEKRHTPYTDDELLQMLTGDFWETPPMYRFLLKYPTRNRPELFKSTFSKYRDMLSGKHQYEWVVSMDVDDRSMNNQDMINWIDQQKNVWYCFGENKSKVQAINANMDGRDFDILILVSDDMIPAVQGYDDIIAQQMVNNFSDLSGCLHFNDGRVGNDLNTLSIMGKKLYDRFGYIYNPQYKSLWCDNEFTEVTKAWNKTIYVDQVIIKHSWIDVTGNDELHGRNEALYEADKLTYEKRKQAGFPFEEVNINLPIIKDRRRPFSRWRK